MVFLRMLVLLVVMEDDEIIERGDQDTLMAENRFYTDLYHSQFEIVT